MLFVFIPAIFFISISYITWSFPEIRGKMFLFSIFFALLSGIVCVLDGLKEKILGFRVILIVSILAVLLLILDITQVGIGKLFSLDYPKEKISYVIGLFLSMGISYLSPAFIYTIYYYISYTSEIEEIAEDINKVIDENESLKSKISILSNEHDSLIKQRFDNNNIIEELERKIQTYKQKELDDLRVLKEEKLHLYKENEKYQSQIKEYQSQIELIKNSHQTRQTMIDEGNKDLEILQEKLEKSKIKMEQTQIKIDDLQENMEQEKQRRAHLESDLAYLKNIKNEQDIKIKDLQKELDKNKGHQRKGEFISTWTKMEKILKIDRTNNKENEETVNNCIRNYYERGIISKELKDELHQIYKKRCIVVHMGESVSQREVENIKEIYEAFKQAIHQSAT